MDRETLAAAVEALAVPYRNESDKLWSTINATLDSFLAEAGVSKIAKLRYRDGYSAEVEVEIPGKTYGHTMSIHFHENYWDDEDTKKTRKVELNVGTFGSFSAEDKPEVNFYIVAGAIAQNLSKLQEKLDAVDFTPYKEAWRAYNHAKYELERLDHEVRDAEHAKLLKDIEAKLVPGAKLRVGYNWKKEPIYDTIAHVTSKNIVLEKDYGRRTKKENAVNNIILKRWEFAA